MPRGLVVVQAALLSLLFGEIITEDRRALGGPAPSGLVMQQILIGKLNSQKAREI